MAERKSVKKSLTFEEAMKRLDEITVSLGDKSISLDEGVKLYTESMELVAFCKTMLDKAEGKITVVVNGKEEDAPSEMD